MRRPLLCLHGRDPQLPALSLSLFCGVGLAKLCHIFQRHWVSRGRQTSSRHQGAPMALRTMGREQQNLPLWRQMTDQTRDLRRVQGTLGGLGGEAAPRLKLTLLLRQGNKGRRGGCGTAGVNGLRNRRGGRSRELHKREDADAETSR